VFSNLSPNGRGILAMTGASIAFVFSDVLAKLATLDWPVAQLMAVRGLFAVMISLAVVIVSGDRQALGGLTRPLMTARSATEAVLGITFLSALGMMPIADLTALLMLSPLVITAIATLLLGETVGWRRWSAILVGFAGMLLVVKPGGAQAQYPLYHVAAILGLAAVLGVALRDILTRKLGNALPTTVVTLGTSIGSWLAGLALSLFQPWAPFQWRPFLACLVAAVIVTVGNYFIALACRGADLSVVAPYRFSSVIWAIALGALVFGEVPGALSIAGIALIAASALYTLHRERVRARTRLDGGQR